VSGFDGKDNLFILATTEFIVEVETAIDVGLARGRLACEEIPIRFSYPFFEYVVK
jgi:hypothetical protein